MDNNTSYIRFLHAAPNVPGINVTIDGKRVAENLTYTNLTEYIPILPGRYNIKVTLVGTGDAEFIDTVLTVPESSALTIAADGNPDWVSLQIIPEMLILNKPAENVKDAYIRVVHLSPNTLPIDVRLLDGTNVFENISYEMRSDYKRIPAGTYTLQVAETGNPNIVLTIPNVTFEPGIVYTIYAVGLTRNNPPLGALLTDEGGYM